jgi:hypothetical protein
MVADYKVIEEETRQCRLWRMSITSLSSSVMQTNFFNTVLLVKQLRGNYETLVYTCLYLYLIISGEIFPWILC